MCIRDRVHTAVYSIVLELIVECFNRRGIMGLAFPFMHPIIFIYNTLIIMTSIDVYKRQLPIRIPVRYRVLIYRRIMRR